MVVGGVCFTREELRGYLCRNREVIDTEVGIVLILARRITRPLFHISACVDGEMISLPAGFARPVPIPVDRVLQHHVLILHIRAEVARNLLHE